VGKNIACDPDVITWTANCVSIGCGIIIAEEIQLIPHSPSQRVMNTWNDALANGTHGQDYFFLLAYCFDK